MRWLRSISTDENWDADVVIWAIIGSVVFIWLMSWRAGPTEWDVEKFGLGMGSLLGGGGLGYAVKRYGEKNNNNGNNDSSSTP